MASNSQSSLSAFNADQQSLKHRSFSEQFKTYLLAHAQALFSSLGRQVRSPFTSIMTTLVLAMALTLAGSFYSVIKNAQQLTGSIETSNQLSLFLKQSISDQKAKKLADKLPEHEQIHSVVFISRDQALEEFKQYSGFGDALKALDENPLPAVIQVLPNPVVNNSQTMQALITELEKHPEVDFAQADMQWLKRLQSFMLLAERAVELLALLIGTAVLFITGNTIRLEMHNRKDEIVIAKLVGATDRFIQRPFLYSGFWYGFLAGIIAWMLITIMQLVLQSPVSRLAALYSGDFTLLFFNALESLTLIVLASSLGVIGAWSVLRFQLHALKPE